MSFALVIGVVLAAPLPALAGGTGADLGDNGQHLRPFYIYAHNPNEVDTAKDAVQQGLDAGANALEPDVMTFGTTASYQGTLVDSTAGASGMFIYHDNTNSPVRMPQTLERWLGDDGPADCSDTTGNWRLSVAAKIVCDGANIASIAFDIKSQAAASQSSPTGPHDGGVRMHVAMDKFRQVLTDNGVPVSRQPWIIYSVGDVGDANNLFQTAFTSLLTSHEGIMIDGGGSAPDITTRFLLSKFDSAHLRSAQVGYGSGGIDFDIGRRPNTVPDIEQASAQNLGFDQAGIELSPGGAPRPIAIPYVFTVNSESDMNRVIDAGADGEIPDVGIDLPLDSSTVAHIQTLSGIVNHRNDVFLASAADNPFDNQKREGYALRIHTTNELNAGTDANLTFTLKGCRGSSSVTISTTLQREYEQDQVNRVTIPSEDLGSLQSLTIHNDNTGPFGPVGSGWNFDNVQLASDTYGVPVGSLTLNSLGGDPGVDGNGTVTIPVSGGNTNCIADVFGTGRYGGDASSFSFAPAGGTPPIGVTLTGTATCTMVSGGHAIDTLAPGNYILDPRSCSGVTGSSAHDSYTPTYRGGPFIVARRPLGVSAGPESKNYGDANPAISAPFYTGPPPLNSPSDAFINGDTPGSSLDGNLGFATPATAASPVGTYPLHLFGLSSSKYDISYTDPTLTVSPALLTVAVADASRAYGADPTFATTISGFKNGETLATSGVTGKPSCTTTATFTSTVAGSPYPITCRIGTLSGANYGFGGALNLATANLTITRAATATALDITGNPSVYGQAVTMTATVGPKTDANGLNDGTTDGGGTVAFTDGTKAITGCDAQPLSASQPYQATCTTAGLRAGGHQITATYSGDGNATGSTSTAAALTVSGAALNITASSGSMVYGHVPPAISPAYAGFVNGDNPSSLTTAPTCSTTATSASSVAGSPYGSSCTGAIDPNYTITYTPGSVAVTPMVLTVTADPKTKTYGQPNPASTATDTGFVNGDTPASLGGTLSFATTATPTSPVGSYDVTPSGLTSGNYAITFVKGTLKITQANSATTLAASPNPSEFGQSVTLTATVAPLPSGAGTATGTVTFKDGAATLGTAAVSAGKAMLSTGPLTLGSHGFTASYAGDANVTTSTSATLAQVVAKARSTLVAAPTGRLQPQFAATLTRAFDGLALSGDTVTFSASGQTICSAKTNTRGEAACAPLIGLFLGVANYTATFAGDANYLATSANGKFN